MHVAVDVCIGKRGVRALRKAGWRVTEAEHGEMDRSWMRRAKVADDVDVVISADWDIGIVCRDMGVGWFRPKQNESGVQTAERFLRHSKSFWNPGPPIKVPTY